MTSVEEDLGKIARSEIYDQQAEYLVQLGHKLMNEAARLRTLAETMRYEEKGWQLVPTKITPAIACALEGCAGPEKQSAESIKFLMDAYKQQWANVLAAAQQREGER